MRYMSIYKAVETGRPPTQDHMDEMGKLIEKTIQSGALISTGGLLPSATGARVRLSNGKITVTDGPFTESKEIIGGFAILEAASKEAAIELAEEFLYVAGEGVCEVRPLHMGPV
jgi:hypothetical protein